MYIVLFSIAFTINVGIGTYFVYYKYMNSNKKTDRKEKFYFLAKIIRRNLLNLKMGQVKEINIKN